MITDNERDERTAAWLIEQYGAEAVTQAEAQLAGARKSYPSNIAKILGAELPESLKYTSKETARSHIAKMKETLAKSKTDRHQQKY